MIDLDDKRLAVAKQLGRYDPEQLSGWTSHSSEQECSLSLSSRGCLPEHGQYDFSLHGEGL
jgi:hypothetical protein